MTRASPPAVASAVPPAVEAAVGLCVRCRHAIHQPSTRGPGFWRCGRARSDPGFLKYPPLPVRACPGFEPPGEAGDGPESHKVPSETTPSG